MNDRLFISALRLLPKNSLSRAAGALARWRAPAALRLAATRAFARHYGIDLSEFPGIESYSTFGEFFSRPLLPGRRPVAPGDDVAVSPVDGVVSEAGRAQRGRLFQVKGITYSIAGLFADDDIALRFAGGVYATIYLSPRDYHRIHFPVGGKVTGWRYVPGELWPVSSASVRAVRGLYTLNERLTTYVEGPLGRCAIVAVGATVVGRVHASYDPSVPHTNEPGASPRRGQYDAPIPVEKGQELGAFEMGSTVVVLFEPGKMRLDPRIVPGARVKVGEAIGGAP